jgi:hypothetical protein
MRPGGYTKLNGVMAHTWEPELSKPFWVCMHPISPGMRHNVFQPVKPRRAHTWATARRSASALQIADHK